MRFRLLKRERAGGEASEMLLLSSEAVGGTNELLTRRNKNSLNSRRLSNLPDESMFPSTGSDNKNLHVVIISCFEEEGKVKKKKE